MQCGEWIRGPFWARLRDGGQKRRFTRIGIADQTDIRDGAQLKQIITFGSRFPRLRETGCLSPGGGKIAIAQAAASSLAQDELLAVFSQIGHQLLLGFITRGPPALLLQIQLDGAFRTRMTYDRAVAG